MLPRLGFTNHSSGWVSKSLIPKKADKKSPKSLNIWKYEDVLKLFHRFDEYPSLKDAIQHHLEVKSLTSFYKYNEERTVHFFHCVSKNFISSGTFSWYYI